MENKIIIEFDMDTLEYITSVGGFLVGKFDTFEDAINDFDDLVSDFYINEILRRTSDEDNGNRGNR